MITEAEWQSIRSMVEGLVPTMTAARKDYLVTGTVKKVDKKNKLVWLAEFQSQAIPIIAYDYDVTYYDTDSTGVVRKKVTKATARMPRVGQTVLVVRELGVSTLPRCLGVLMGRNWIAEE